MEAAATVLAGDEEGAGDLRHRRPSPQDDNDHHKRPKQEHRAAGEDGLMWSSDRETGEACEGILCSMAASTCGAYLFTGSSDRSLRVWDARPSPSAPPKRCLHTVANAHDDWIRGVCILPGSDLVFTCSRDETVRVWRFLSLPDGLPSLRLEGILRGHTDWVRWVVARPKSQDASEHDFAQLFSLSDDNTVREWDLAPFLRPARRGEGGHVTVVAECLRKITSPDEIKSLAVCPDGTCVYIGLAAMGPGGHSVVRCVNMDHGSVTKTFQGHRGDVTCLKVVRMPRPVNRSAAAAAAGPPCQGCESTPHFLYTAGDDGLVRKWCTQTGNLLNMVFGPRDWIRSIEISPDQRFIFMASQDRQIYEIDTEVDPDDEERDEHPDRGHNGAVWDLCLVPNTEDCVLASCGADGLLKLWVVRFPLAAWSPEVHPLYRRRFKTRVRELLLAANRCKGLGRVGGDVGIGQVPQLALFRIIGCLADFERKMMEDGGFRVFGRL